jgi:hypothetical protein
LSASLGREISNARPSGKSFWIVMGLRLLAQACRAKVRVL